MKPTVLLAALLATALAGPAVADSHNAGMSGDRPSRGMSEQSVEARFGAPAAKVAAVGEPPISRWEYADFIVYFEHDKVIHAVNRRR